MAEHRACRGRRRVRAGLVKVFHPDLVLPVAVRSRSLGIAKTASASLSTRTTFARVSSAPISFSSVTRDHRTFLLPARFG